MISTERWMRLIPGDNVTINGQRQCVTAVLFENPERKDYPTSIRVRTGRTPKQRIGDAIDAYDDFCADGMDRETAKDQAVDMIWQGLNTKTTEETFTQGEVE